MIHACVTSEDPTRFLDHFEKMNTPKYVNQCLLTKISYKRRRNVLKIPCYVYAIMCLEVSEIGLNCCLKLLKMCSESGVPSLENFDDIHLLWFAILTRNGRDARWTHLRSHPIFEKLIANVNKIPKIALGAPNYFDISWQHPWFWQIMCENGYDPFINDRPWQYDLQVIDNSGCQGYRLISLNVELKVGSFVDVLDTTQQWLKAEILAIKDLKVLIRYVGWLDKWNEWIHYQSIRLAPANSSSWLTNSVGDCTYLCLYSKGIGRSAFERTGYELDSHLVDNLLTHIQRGKNIYGIRCIPLLLAVTPFYVELCNIIVSY